MVTLIQLQQDMVNAMKAKNYFRKTVISVIIAAIKKAAIDEGRRNNIDEEFVNGVLLKMVKTAKESVDTCPDSRADLKEKYLAELKIIQEYAPTLITDSEEIKEILRTNYDGTIMSKNALMNFLGRNYRGKIDMKVASKVVGEIVG